MKNLTIEVETAPFEWRAFTALDGRLFEASHTNYDKAKMEVLEQVCDYLLSQRKGENDATPRLAPLS